MRLVLRRRTAFALTGLVMAGTHGMLATGVGAMGGPWITSVAGMAVLFGIPAFLLCMADAGRAPAGVARSERLATSVVVALGLLMAAGLAANTLLPHAGVARPLDGEAVILFVEISWIGLGAWAWRRHPETYALGVPSLGGRARVVLTSSVAVVAMAATGAIRLNNGAGGGLTLCMLVVAGVTFALLLAWRIDLAAVPGPGVPKDGTGGEGAAEGPAGGTKRQAGKGRKAK